MLIDVDAGKTRFLAMAGTEAECYLTTQMRREIGNAEITRMAWIASIVCLSYAARRAE
jgi:hypothetical protein